MSGKRKSRGRHIQGRGGAEERPGPSRTLDIKLPDGADGAGLGTEVLPGDRCRPRLRRSAVLHRFPVRARAPQGGSGGTDGRPGGQGMAAAARRCGQGNPPDSAVGPRTRRSTRQ